MRASGSRRSDQGAVWEDIAAKSARMNTDSPTQAMSAVFERHAISVEEYVRAFACGVNQCGVAFAIGTEFGLDLFDHPAFAGSLWTGSKESSAKTRLSRPTRRRTGRAI